MKKSPSYEADSRSAGQEIARVFVEFEGFNTAFTKTRRLTVACAS
jgi:hypothetical protein